MSETFSELEQQLAAVPMRPAGDALRAAVLAGISLELRAARWDRQLLRVTIMLLLVGVGLNTAIALNTTPRRFHATARNPKFTTRQALVDTAVVIAGVTDRATGSQYARQMATMSGRDLTSEELALLDAALRDAKVHESANGTKG
jgi:hypothetical protein